MNRIFLLVFCLFLGFAQGGANVIVPEEIKNYFPVEIGIEDNCNLPAPTNLALSNITTTTMDADWDAVSGAVGYLVEAYRDDNNALLFSATETGTSRTITGLPSGTLVRVEVSAMCPGGEVSEFTAEKSGTTDIVIEVITMNFNCPNLDFIDVKNNYVDFAVEYIISDDAVYHGELYQIDNNNYYVSNKFYFKCVWEGENFKGYIYPDNENNSSPLGDIKGSNFEDTCSSCDYAQVVSETNLRYCKLRFSSTTSFMPKLTIELNVPYADDQYFFKIEKCSAQVRESNKENDSSAFLIKSNKNFDLSPNPISNYTEIKFSDCIDDGHVDVQILNITGEVLLSRSTLIDCDYLPLNLDRFSLSLKGFYIMRVISKNFIGSKWIYIN